MRYKSVDLQTNDFFPFRISFKFSSLTFVLPTRRTDLDGHSLLLIKLSAIPTGVIMHSKRQGRAWYHWFAKDDTPEEKRLILKLDLLIIPYAVVAYWIKYIDQSNLSKYKESLADQVCR